jgi:NADH dehydrogenase
MPVRFEDTRMRVLVLGAGYAGVALTRKLERTLDDDVDILVVDDTGTHVVQHEVHRVVRKPRIADHITLDLHELFDRAEVREGTVVDVDADANEVALADGTVLSYDVGAVCLGAETAYYGLPGVREHATPCKRVEHAKRIRASALDAIDADGHAIVGGAGLSGIQVAGELAALAEKNGPPASTEGVDAADAEDASTPVTISIEDDATDQDDDASSDDDATDHDDHASSDDDATDRDDHASSDDDATDRDDHASSDDDTTDHDDHASSDDDGVAGDSTATASAHDVHGDLSVTVLEMQPSVAPGFPENFQTAVHETLEAAGVDVRTNATVEEATADAVVLEDGTELQYDTFVWTGGIAGPEATDGDRVDARADLRVDGDTFVVGDAGRVVDADGEAVPASAQSAIREARVAAANVQKLVEHRRRDDAGAFEPRLKRFDFDSPGWLVSIGNDAVAQVGPTVLTGRAAVALKASVGAGYLSGIGELQNATDLVNDELDIDPGHD